jgi:hypothetical protein
MGGDSALRSVDAAWAAGFLDGEGSIGVYRSHSTYSLTVYAGQKVREPLDKLSEMFGGNVRWNAKRSQASGLWDWKRHGVSAVAVLEAVMPYLTVKRPQAELAIEFQAILQSAPLRVRLTGADLDLRRRYYDELRALKH